MTSVVPKEQKFRAFIDSCISKVLIRTEQMRNVDLSQRSWRDSFSPQRKLWVNRREVTEPASGRHAVCFCRDITNAGINSSQYCPLRSETQKPLRHPRNSQRGSGGNSEGPCDFAADCNIKKFDPRFS